MSANNYNSSDKETLEELIDYFTEIGQLEKVACLKRIAAILSARDELAAAVETLTEHYDTDNGTGWRVCRWAGLARCENDEGVVLHQAPTACEAIIKAARAIKKEKR